MTWQGWYADGRLPPLRESQSRGFESCHWVVRCLMLGENNSSLNLVTILSFAVNAHVKQWLLLPMPDMEAALTCCVTGPRAIMSSLHATELCRSSHTAVHTCAFCDDNHILVRPSTFKACQHHTSQDIDISRSRACRFHVYSSSCLKELGPQWFHRAAACAARSARPCCRPGR